MQMDSPALLAMAAAPAASLLAFAFTWRLWPTGWREIPATAISIGLTLLFLLVAVIAEYAAEVPTILAHGPELLFSSLAICYCSALLYFSRKDGVALWRLAVLGAMGLVPGYHLAGYTLMSSVCGIRSAGC